MNDIQIGATDYRWGIFSVRTESVLINAIIMIIEEKLKLL